MTGKRHGHCGTGGDRTGDLFHLRPPAVHRPPLYRRNQGFDAVDGSPRPATLRNIRARCGYSGLMLAARM